MILFTESQNRFKVNKAEKGLSQRDLTKIVNVSRQTISSIEIGQLFPSAKLALLICIALNKKFEEVFYFEQVLLEVVVKDEVEALE